MCAHVSLLVVSEHTNHKINLIMRGEIVRESRKGGERESERRRERRESEIDSKREGREREEGRESVCVCVCVWKEEKER